MPKQQGLGCPSHLSGTGGWERQWADVGTEWVDWDLWSISYPVELPTRAKETMIEALVSLCRHLP